MSTRRNSSSSKPCCFCNLTEDNELDYGKLYEYNGIVTHYYCLLLSSNMEQKGQDNEGILGFLTDDIQKELRRGKRLACSYCKKIGATLGCCNTKCKRIFHFPCGLKAGSLHQFFGEFKSFCINHRPKQALNSVLKEINSIDNLLCCICYDKVNPNDPVGTLWAPCCKKDAWFHRRCVQQLAVSAGYFFKCPLCNNKNDFQKVMQENGIFVPSQDASWELVPNAFEELLYRHDQCDAALCQCPKGRKHTSSNAKWELVLCRTCGSQGIHMACGQLKWANPVWDCVECTSILCSAKNSEQVVKSSSSNSSSSFSSIKEFDSGSDSDSDTDISVGTEFPIYSSHNFSLSPSSSSSSLSNMVPANKLRPGPRSFKLQQQIKQTQINKRTSTCSDLEKNETDAINTKDANNLLLKNDIIKKKSLTSKESIPQQRREENNMQKNDKQNNSQGEKKSSVSKINVKKPIEKKTDVITIESDDDDDDDDDDDVKIILLNRKTSQVPSQRSNESHVTNNPVSSKHSNATLINCSEIVLSRESTPNLSSSSENMDALNVDESPIMNIKITNVTSLAPEVFESVDTNMTSQDVALKNSADKSVPMLEKNVSEKCIGSMLPLKRSMHEVSGTDNNCKKIKENDFSKNYNKENSMESCITAVDMSTQQTRMISPIKSNEIHKEDSSTSCNVQSIKEKSVKRIMNSELRITKCNNPIPRINLFPKLNSNFTNSQNIRNDKANAECTAPSSTATLPQTINNTNVINNNQITTFEKQPISKTIDSTICAENNNQTGMSDNHKTVTLATEKSIVKVSSPGHESSNKILCDGDAGTSRAEIKSTGRRKRRLPSEYNENIHINDIVSSQSLATTRSVFLQVTSNHNTCRHPRLIPQYMDLDDLKFRVCGSDNVQMILYDTFSVNISMKNPKKSKKRSAGFTSKEYTLISRTRDEASSSIDYIAEQRIDKFYRFLKNENNLNNDKTKFITSRDDAKENLDPIKTKTLSRNDIFNNSSLMNETEDTMIPSDYVCENDNEIRLISSDTNLSTFNRKICNVNVDNVVDDVEFERNNCNQTSRIDNFEDVQQQISVNNIISESKEEKTSNDRLFCEGTRKTESSVDLDLNIVSSNKSVEKVLQDNITFFINKHVDDNREIRHDYTNNSSVLWNDKRLNGMDITRLKAQNRSVTRMANVTYNEHNISNKEIHTYDTGRFIQCTMFHENTENHNSEDNIKHNVESCFKVSIDLCKIQNFIHTKPDLFINQKHEDDNQRRKNISYLCDRDDHTQQQIC